MKCNSNISKHFEKFLSALKKTDKKECHPDTSFQIYYDLFKIREAQWKYKIDTSRGIDYSLSDIFQDIIARYLRIYLPKKYKILIEYKQGSLRPDILIKKSDKPWAIIEIKTTVGWNRDLVRSNDYLIRLKELSTQFKVPLKRVFYIFESSRNVDKNFASLFQSNKNTRITKFILPLFEQNASPYYITKREKNKAFRRYTTKEIFRLYESNKINDFKDIIKRVR